MLYAVVNKTGILQSIDGGSKWDIVTKGQGQTEILMPTGRTSVAYSCSISDVWRTKDGGKTYEHILTDVEIGLSKMWCRY
jgi:hypothetical protein